jgi:hypothetical protein
VRVKEVSRRLSYWPEAESHIRTVLSWLLDTTVRPSGENATTLRN